MKLSYLKISNFRNLDGLEIHFNPENNFIVGENNLGKTNILHLLNTVFRNTYRTGFLFEDFKDAESRIEIRFTLLLHKMEIGLFEDLFDSDVDIDQITIFARQESPDDYMEYFHDETELRISPSTIKCTNFLYYDSLRDPDKELTFDKGKGVGRFLNHLVSKQLADAGSEELEFIDKTKTTDVLNGINSVLSKIKAFKDYEIDAQLEDSIQDLVSKLFLLKDGDNRGLSQTGYGVRFLVVISLFILNRLLDLGKIKSKKGIFEDEDKKGISLILGLDEPEIHLHPYMQRSLIKSVRDIILNKDAEFSEVLKKAFDIDVFIGQSIVVTHSPNILLKDYKQLIRLHRDGNGLQITSGYKVMLSENLEKQLQIQFPYIREAFFARAAIVVEGDSELSSFPILAKKINPDYDFDQLGIAIVNVGGKESVEPVLKLLEKFKIPAIGVVDRDKGASLSASNIVMTDEHDFECELLKIIGTRRNFLRDIVTQIDSLGLERVMQVGALAKNQKKYPTVLDQTVLTGDIKLKDIEGVDLDKELIWYSTWLRVNKNILTSSIIADELTSADIPNCYKKAITDVVNLVS